MAQTTPKEFDNDPALHLVTEDGLEIWPARHSVGRYLFMVPAGASGLRLRSHAARPMDAIGAFADDNRILGVKIGEVTLWHGRKKFPSTDHLTAMPADGWFDIENNEAMRWTNGNASLPVSSSETPFLLEIEVWTLNTYRMPENLDVVRRTDPFRIKLKILKMLGFEISERYFENTKFLLACVKKLSFVLKYCSNLSSLLRNLE